MPGLLSSLRLDASWATAGCPLPHVSHPLPALCAQLTLFLEQPCLSGSPRAQPQQAQGLPERLPCVTEPLPLPGYPGGP